MSSVDHAPILVRAADVGLRGLYQEVLAPFSITIRQGECWIVTGPNGSGKSIAAEIIAGVREAHSGTLEWPGMADAPQDHVQVVSFERQERIMERERREDLSSIMEGALDPGHRVRDLLADAAGAAALAQKLRIDHILDRGLRFLSTGEFRKTLLASAVSRSPKLLVLDEPYDGLDQDARRELSGFIEDMHSADGALLLVLNRRRDFPTVATHVLELCDGSVRYSGEIAEWDGESTIPRLSVLPVPGASHSDAPVSAHPSAAASNRNAQEDATGGPSHPNTGGETNGPKTPIVTMRDVSVRYGTNPVLDNVTWTVRPDDRWMIHGPNGSGKSTLLSLIIGDNPKAYGQEISLFGRKKGSGESVWEIKKRIGMVSGDLQFRYPVRERVLPTVLSGFFDSIGLYERESGYQDEIAQEWIERIGLRGQENARLRELSFGQRRMVLIARAMVKDPDLLIADEPCQGLDDEHAEAVIELLDGIGSDHAACLLYVTHNRDEMLSCLTHELDLVPGPAGSRGIVRVLR